MRAFLDRTSRALDHPVDATPRLLLLLATLLLLPVYTSPLWTMTMFAPQYRDGLRLRIYSYKLDGGHAGQDVKEINVLNHYIGMKDLATEDFTEFKWIPFVVGILGLLFLRAVVHGKLSHLVDVLVLYVYFGLFSLASFAHRMWSYGHNLQPTAAVKVAPFMPPLFGYKQLANFEVYSYPGLAGYSLVLVALVLALALWIGWRESRWGIAVLPK